jgi:superfamily II DNA or RNA helicase
MKTNLNTYLGQKGYTIPKNELTIEEQKKIRNDLNIKPYTPGAPVQIQKTFPAYRESDKKIYLPRYFGEEYFGKAKTSKISEGVDINLAFQGELRENQVPVVNKYLEHTKNGDGGLLELPCGFGKCLGKGTKVMLYDGNFKLVENIQIGDLLMGDDSTPRKVLSLARGREQMYKITSKKGDMYLCNESHILSLKSSTNHSKKILKDSIIDISVKDFLDLPKSFHGKGGVLLGYKVGIHFENKPIRFDPYLFGYWLGDGASKGPIISTQEGSIIKYMADLFKTAEYNDLYLSYISQYDYRICSLKKNNRFMTFLRKNNLINNKHIPYNYKCNNRDIQLKVLAGLIDSDGHHKSNCYEIVQKNSLLAEDIVYLCRSLGFSCYSKNDPKEGEYNRICIYGKGLEEIPILCKRKISSHRKQIKDALTYRLNIEKLEIDDYYGFEIDGNKRFVLGDFTVTHNTSIALNLISRLKKKTIVIVHKEFLMNQWIERIQQFLPEARIGKIQGQVIDVDNKDIVLCMLQSLVLKEYPSSLFDTFGLTIIDEVHHISSETFSCALFKLVTKYMLGLSATMNRKDGTTKVFKMFLGEVVYKVERKGDANVQIRSVTFKTNDEEFNDVILDHKGQPQISSMISKLCVYNRRTEFIIKLLTDFIEVNNVDNYIIQQYKNEMDNNNPKCEICNNNNNYLVKNVCCNSVKYCLRCMDKIVETAKITKDKLIDKKTGEIRLTKKRPKCPNCNKVLNYEQNYIENKYVKPLAQLQTIVLSHNLNVLEYIYTKIVCKNLASVGYYVGGMSEEELKKSEKKQIILATFAIANEGLDIPSLNAEFLITPKTDVVQTIGRVLRAKHAHADPIIYDINDSHDVFQRQWLKRKTYYKKNNYQIIECDSYNYTKDISKWKHSILKSKDFNNENNEDDTDNFSKGICFLKH